MEKKQLVKEYQSLLEYPDKVNREKFFRLMAISEYLGRDIEETIGENEHLKDLYEMLVQEKNLLSSGDILRQKKSNQIFGDPDWEEKKKLDAGMIKCELCKKMSITCDRYEIYDDKEKYLGTTGWLCTKCKYKVKKDVAPIQIKIQKPDIISLRKVRCIKCGKSGSLFRYAVSNAAGKRFCSGWKHKDCIKSKSH